MIVVDHTKFGVVAHGRTADFSQIHITIADASASPEFLEDLQTHNIEVLLA